MSAATIQRLRVPGERRLRLLAFGIAIVPFLALAWRLDCLVDDAYIVFRFSRNLAHGHGLNYNIGVVPPVEGYTQFAWVVWNAGLIKLGLDVLVWSRISLVIAGLAVLWTLAGSTARRFPERPAITIVTTLFLATLPPMAAWATGGMEAMAFTLFALLAYEALLGDRSAPRGLRAGLWLALMGLTRADAPVLIALILGSAALSWLFWRRTPELFRAIAIASTIAAATVLAYVGFRLDYFGAFLPNTAYTKVSMSPITFERGSNYVIEFFLTYPALAVLLVAGVWALRRPAEVIAHALLICIGLCVYVIGIGGDFMPFRRFLVPALPFMALLFAACLARVTPWRSRRRKVAIGAACAAIVLNVLPAFDLYPTPRSVRARFHYNWNLEYGGAYQQWRFLDQVVEGWVVLGKALAEHTQPGESLVRKTIGAVGYYSDLFIYDQHGLVEPSVARRSPSGERRSIGHDKLVPRSFFLPQRPTYLEASLVRTAAASRVLAIKRKRDAGDELRDYEWVAIPIQDMSLLFLERRAESESGDGRR